MALRLVGRISRPYYGKFNATSSVSLRKTSTNEMNLALDGMKIVQNLNNQSNDFFYHRYSHSNSPFDLNLVDQLFPTTDCLNFYYPRKFCGPLNNKPVLEAIDIVEGFYERHRLRDLHRPFVYINNSLVRAGSLVNSDDPRWAARSWLEVAFWYVLDDLYEDLISKCNDSAEFAIKVMNCIYSCINSPDMIPPKFVAEKVGNHIVEEVNLLVKLWLDLIKMARDIFPESQFRAWCKISRHFVRMWTDYEQFIIRTDLKKPINVYGFIWSRAVTVGMCTNTAYLLDEKWDLDRNYRNDNYFTRLVNFHHALYQDTISAMKEFEEIKRSPTFDRVMSYPHILISRGMSPEDALIKTVTEANELMALIDQIYEDSRFQHLRNFLYSDVRADVHYAYLQAQLPRYNWTKIKK